MIPEIHKYKDRFDNIVAVQVIQRRKNAAEVIRVERINGRIDFAGFWIHENELIVEESTVIAEILVVKTTQSDEDLRGRINRLMNLSGEFNNPVKAKAYTEQLINTVEAWLQRKEDE